MVALIWQCKGVPYFVLKFEMYDTVITSPSFHCIYNLGSDSPASLLVCASWGLDVMDPASTEGRDAETRPDWTEDTCCLIWNPLGHSQRFQECNIHVAAHHITFKITCLNPSFDQAIKNPFFPYRTNTPTPQKNINCSYQTRLWLNMRQKSTFKLSHCIMMIILLSPHLTLK